MKYLISKFCLSDKITLFKSFTNHDKYDVASLLSFFLQQGFYFVLAYIFKLFICIKAVLIMHQDYGYNASKDALHFVVQEVNMQEQHYFCSVFNQLNPSSYNGLQ